MPRPFSIHYPRNWHSALFFSSVVLLTGLATLLFADLLWRTGWSGSRTVLLVLFILLFMLTAIGGLHAVFGFVLRRLGEPGRLTLPGDYAGRSIIGTSTAIVFAVYNEDARRVYEGVRTTYLSLRQTGRLDEFDFFILSDSTDPAKWIEEEKRWFALVRELDALGRIYYRRRVLNEGKKCGNVRDFLSTWGRHYRYFIVCDADSVMQGATLVNLVQLMETHPAAGLIQTVPALVNAESLFGRLQQFANRLYGPVFLSGLNFWAQGMNNYWGHNAIIRTEPFMQHCDLPNLPGRKPFGGQILSHDFVEAALLVKAHWQVWLVSDLGGSFEEAPQDLIENARRDRRWCQGNLQHSMVLFAHGLRGSSRIHLLLGIFGYLSGPLWLLFLITFNWTRSFHLFTGLSDIGGDSFTPYLARFSATAHALLVFGLCMFLVLLPKLLALIDLACDPVRRCQFGGLPSAMASVAVETLFSTLHAPLQMLWHTRFVVSALLGTSVNWGTQQRTADGTSLAQAVRCHWSHTLIGLAWGSLVWWLDRPVFVWFIPVVAGLVLSIPLSIFTSRVSAGQFARRWKIALSPEETDPPAELVHMRARLQKKPSPECSLPELSEVVLDPYVNAVHISLLRENLLNPEYAHQFARLGVGYPEMRTLGELLLTEGPSALIPRARLLVLSDPDVMSWLHQQIWLRPVDTLAPWWQKALHEVVAR